MRIVYTNESERMQESLDVFEEVVAAFVEKEANGESFEIERGKGDVDFAKLKKIFENAFNESNFSLGEKVTDETFTHAIKNNVAYYIVDEDSEEKEIIGGFGIVRDVLGGALCYVMDILNYATNTEIYKIKYNKIF